MFDGIRMNDMGSTATVPARKNALLWLPFLALPAIYLPALYDLVIEWYTDPNYSHGFLIPIISGFLLWKKREAILSAPRATDYGGLVVLIAGLLLFVVANSAAEYFTIRLSFLVTFIGLVYCLFGREIVKLARFELLFLVFMVPIPYLIYYTATVPMQLLASKITVWALNMIGAGAIRQGNIIYLGNTALEVADACSGMRSLVSLLALGCLYAHLSQKRPSAKLILFASTVPIAVIGNAFRVFVTSLLTYTVTENVTDEPLHTILGLSVFVVAFVLLFILATILRRLYR